MSLHEQARKLVDQAGTLIQAGNPQYATELLRQAILYNSRDGEAYVLLGIALAQTKMPVDAENAFKKAVQLAPDNVKARYNLAVHQYVQGEMQAALLSARAASEIDTRHAGSADLVTRIETELGLEPGATPKRTVAGNPVPEYRPGYEELAVQTMPFVERLGRLWPAIGWMIAVVSLTCGIIFFSIVLPFMSGHGGSIDEAIKALGSDPRVGVIRICYFIANVGGLAFIGVDAINRGGNLLWLLPQAICGCTGFTFVIVPLYMVMGRKD